MKNLVLVMLIALMTTLGLTWTASPQHQPNVYSTMACGGVEGMGDFCAQ